MKDLVLWFTGISIFVAGASFISSILLYFKSRSPWMLYYLLYAGVIIVVLLLSSGCISIKTIPEIRETDSVTFYDNGGMKGAQALGPMGHLVHYSPIDTRIRIDAVFIYCSTYGNYSKKTRIFILDSQYRVIKRMEVDPDMFPNAGKGSAIQDCYPDKFNWVKISVGNVTVENDFYLLIFTFSDNQNGIMIGYSGGGNKNHTAIGNVRQPLPWTLPMNKNMTNWVIRANYSLSKAPLTRPLRQAPANYREAVRVLNTPEKLSEWMLENLCYDSMYGKEHAPLEPEELFVNRSGNCGDFAAFAFDILRKNGFSPLIMALQISLNDPNNHAVCVFKRNGKYFIINNGILQGPFGSYEEILRAHQKNWWRYLLFDTIQNAFGFKDPVAEVYR
jgi:hypothetical protein